MSTINDKFIFFCNLFYYKVSIYTIFPQHTNHLFSLISEKQNRLLQKQQKQEQQTLILNSLLIREAIPLSNSDHKPHILTLILLI